MFPRALIGVPAVVFTLLALALTPSGTQAASGGYVGDNAVESATDSSPNQEVEGLRTTNATAGDVNRISVYLTSDPAATSVLVGLYSNGSGTKPGTLLGSGTITKPTLNAWNSVSVPQVTLSAS